MHKTIRHFLTLLFFSLAAFTLQAQIPHLVFHVEMSGSEAIPATNSDGKSLVTFLFTPDRTKVTVSGMIVKLEGAVIDAKIRLGITGQVGAEVLDLTPLISGRHIVGQLDVPPILLQSLLTNAVYAEIRTTAHPTGEIRGQFLCETDLDFGVLLSGTDAVPSNSSSAKAFGAIHFPLGAHDIVYALVVSGLTGNITDAGIYEGDPGQNGPKIADVTGFFGNVITSIVDLDTIDPDFLRKAREGKYYIAINTGTFPNGEIRGQIRHLGYFASAAPVNGVQQVPPPSPPSPGFGFNNTTVNGTLDSLTTTVFISNLLPTSVKIRIGNPGEVGTELTDMGFSTQPGFYKKKYKITESQLTDFAQGRLFINVTTAAYPNGELRGVMKNTLRKAYAYDLCGTQVVPPVSSDALGIAVASVDQANCYLHYKVITDGLASVPVFGYAAQGNFGANGTAFHMMNNTAPMIEGSHEIMAVLGPIIENSGAYMQIGTSAFPNGEIRGQMKRGFTCPEVVAVTELDNISKVEVSPVPFQDYLNVELESSVRFQGRLVLRDLLGVVAMTQSVQIQDGPQSIQVQTGSLPKGMYMLLLESPSDHGVVLLKKVIKVD